MEAVSFEDFDEINEISVRNIKKRCSAMHLQGNIPQRASFQIPCKFVPQSLSVVDMLKLGKLITDTTTYVEIFNVDMSVMARTGRPTTVDFSIEPEPFGTGGFRKAFKAT